MLAALDCAMWPLRGGAGTRCYLDMNCLSEASEAA